jgi:RsiW-degrading membrane proteinase PrsW (M82 family)
MSALLGFYVVLLAAVVPTLSYVLLFYWADRYEREPGWLAAVAFLWGAIPAIIVSLIAELVLGYPFMDETPNIRTELVESALFAPIIEELAKGLALLLIFRWARHEFDGVLDGLVYGALIGFGFAMTENLFYFLGAFMEGGFADLTVLFLLRVVLFGLNHSFYTALTGIGFGFAREASGQGRWLWPLAGLFAAILAHALHNFGASVADINAAGFGISLLVAVGGLITLLLTVLLSWQRERGSLRTQLADEVGSLLTEEEFRTLTGRWRNPLRKRPADRARARRLQSLIELALRKDRLGRLGAEREPKLAAEIEALRSQLLQSSSADVDHAGV